MNRIREFRAARGWSLRQLAERSGTSKSQVDKLEKGDRRLTVEWMVRLAKPLQCDPRDLMESAPFQTVGFGAARAAASPVARGNALIPVRKTTRGNAQPIDQIPRPYYLAHVKDAYAILIEDNSMIPMYRPGQLLFVNPYKIPQPGGGVVVTDKKDTVQIREFVRATTKTVILRAYKPKPRDITLPLTSVAAIHTVAGTAET
ncbi:MAG TPA: LexA family transcriptional regulator [Alphaproteobacteria bacterium]|nr:LexA family transcriptional regulator [Alphaproteobacteria bacterium]